MSIDDLDQRRRSLDRSTRTEVIQDDECHTVLLDQVEDLLGRSKDVNPHSLSIGQEMERIGFSREDDAVTGSVFPEPFSRLEVTRPVMMVMPVDGFQFVVPYEREKGEKARGPN